MSEIPIIIEERGAQGEPGATGPIGATGPEPTNVVYISGQQQISGAKTFYADNYIFSGADVIFTNNAGIVNGQWLFKNLPTSSEGLPQGSLWVDTSQDNILKIKI